MSPNPSSFLAHLQTKGYHPRSDKHSNSLADCVVADLVKFCPAIAKNAESGGLVYDLNFTIFTGTAEWNVDLVLGQPAMGKSVVSKHGEITRERPSTVQIAIEIKTVMTEHHKAVKNRKRDFEAHHDHVHRYSERAIAGALLVVNISPTFKSPLRPEVTVHRNPDKLVQHCVDQMRAVTIRTGKTGSGLEAKGVIVVELDNENLSSTCFRTQRPAPPVGDPLHYDAFIQAICQIYSDRFS
jgi:hypothetical protein